MRLLISAAAMAVLVAVPAIAQDEPGGPYTELTMTERGADLVVQPANCGPMTDCPSFVLMCIDGSLELHVRNLEVRHVERWATIPDPATLVMGTEVLDFAPGRMTETTDWGWIARTRPASDPAAFLGGLGAEGEIIFDTPFYVFTAVPTESDVVNMGAFGLGCLNAAAATE